MAIIEVPGTGSYIIKHLIFSKVNEKIFQMFTTNTARQQMANDVVQSLETGEGGLEEAW